MYNNQAHVAAVLDMYAFYKRRLLWDEGPISRQSARYVGLMTLLDNAAHMCDKIERDAEAAARAAQANRQENSNAGTTRTLLKG